MRKQMLVIASDNAPLFFNFYSFYNEINLYLEVFMMKKFLAILAGGYMVLCVALIAWIFGCPKSYGRFIAKWTEKVEDGMEEE